MFGDAWNTVIVNIYLQSTHRMTESPFKIPECFPGKYIHSVLLIICDMHSVFHLNSVQLPWIVSEFVKSSSKASYMTEKNNCSILQMTLCSLNALCSLNSPNAFVTSDFYEISLVWLFLAPLHSFRLTWKHSPLWGLPQCRGRKMAKSMTSALPLCELHHGIFFWYVFKCQQFLKSETRPLQAAYHSIWDTCLLLKL